MVVKVLIIGDVGEGVLYLDMTVRGEIGVWGSSMDVLVKNNLE